MVQVTRKRRSRRGRSGSANKKKVVTADGKDQVELALEKAIFGGGEGSERGSEDEEDLDFKDNLFMIDTKRSRVAEGYEEDAANRFSDTEGDRLGSILGLEKNGSSDAEVDAEVDAEEGGDGETVFVKDADAQELELANALFSGANSDGENSSEADSDDDEEEADDDVSFDNNPYPEEPYITTKHTADTNNATEGAVWADPDDDQVFIDITKQNMLKKLRKSHDEKIISGTEYQERLRQQFKTLHPEPSWATKTIDVAASKEEEGLLRHSKLLEGKEERQRLMPDAIDIVRLKDANIADRSQCVVNSVEFHPKVNIMLTAGFDKTLRLFAPNGTTNPKIQGSYLKDMPITKAAFTGGVGGGKGSTHVVMSGNRPYFYLYDLEHSAMERVSGIRGSAGIARDTKLGTFAASPCGTLLAFYGSGTAQGYIHLVSTHDRLWVKSLKQNGDIYRVTFTSDGTCLYATGRSGEVCLWDLSTFRCLHTFRDEGSVGTTSLCLSPDGTYLATGSTSGVVNVYQQDQLFGHAGSQDDAWLGTDMDVANPKPLRALMNLTTRITDIQCHPDGELMAMYSRGKKDAFRLVHLPTRKVYANWPTSATPLRYVNSMSFSPLKRWMAVGNDKGHVLLYKFLHYEGR